MLTDKSKKFLKKYQSDTYQAGGAYGQGNITPNAPMYQQSSDTTLAMTRNIGNQGIPFLSNWTKSVIGGWDFLQSFQDKKKQKVYEQQSQEEISKKYDQMRLNSFYKTPYSYKQGGKYQDGGLLDQAINLQEKRDLGQFQNFFDFNNQSQLDQFNQLREDYQNKNQQKKTEWKNRMSTGLAEHIGAGAASFGEYMSTFGGGMGGGMQRGGFVTKDRMRRLLAPHYYSNYTNKDTNIGYVQGYQQGGYQLTTTNDPGIISTAQVTPQDLQLIRAQRLRELDLNSPSNQSEVNLMKDQSLLSRGIDPNEIKVGGPKKFRYREKQEGGLSDYDPKIDLYSPEFDPNQFLGIEQELDKAEIEDNEHNSLMDWIFNDEGFESNPEEIQGVQDQGDYSAPSGKGVQIGLRMNNPANIKYGEFGKRYGAIPGDPATDGGVFSKFPSMEVGLKAQRDLLTGKSYYNLTVDQAMRRWSNNGYGGDIYPEIKGKRMYELNEDQLKELQKRQIKIETPQAYAQIYSD